MTNDIFVTRPFLPPLEDFVKFLEDIWSTKCLTNKGKYHNRLEKALAEYLDVPYCSLFCNGTTALLTALKALNISGPVITTPFSFPATTHVLLWNGNVPVFCDVDPLTANLDYHKVAQVLTKKVGAILPVHTYGLPCDVGHFEFLAKKYRIPVIYDAAHAFGVKINGRSILSFGECSIVSFHATKIFNTVEGGLLVTRGRKMKERIDLLNNFGIQDEVTVVEAGINGKMNELLAAYGLLQLRYIDRNIKKVRCLAELYRKGLSGTIGIVLFNSPKGATLNYSYFPILIDESAYGESRDELYERLKKNKIFTRRYFYPLISEAPPYSSYPSSCTENLANAFKISRRVLCLPIYPDLAEEDAKRVIALINKKRAV